MKGHRIAVLVDSENLEIAVRDDGKSRGRRGHTVFPNWREILAETVRDRTLVRLIYFKEKGRPLSKKFEQFWEDELEGEIERPVKSADPAIIVTAVTLAEKMDTILLFSGDKDFVPVIPYLKAKGCRVEIASFEQAASNDLRRSADRYYKLSKQHTVELKRTPRAKK